MGNFTSFFSHVIVAWFCCLLPSFRTYKALNNLHQSEELLDRWCKYWAVIGIVFAYQSTVEVFVSWFPLYWELKSLFLVFLALPQTQGSTYIYDAFLKPFLSSNEKDLDAGIDALQSNSVSFLGERLQGLWQFFYKMATNAQPSANRANQTGGGPAQQPSQGGPAIPTLGGLINMAKTYGPALINSVQPKEGSTPSRFAQPAPSASSSATPVPAPEQRNPYTAEPDTAPPPFPEPQHAT